MIVTAIKIRKQDVDYELARIVTQPDHYYFTLIFGGKGFGTLMIQFLFKFPPGLWWVMNSDNDSLLYLQGSNVKACILSYVNGFQ